MSANTSAWVCVVCGYVHQGAEAPDVCPVCGSPKSDFQPQAVQTSSAAPAPQQWRCLICNYVHTGPEPPDSCPVCGADASEFEALAPQSKAEKTTGGAGKVVIVGAGIAGLSAAEAVRAAAPDAEIVLISNEDELPYYRLNLTRLLAGEIGESELPVHPAAWYAEQRIELLRGVEITAVAPDTREIAIAGASPIHFDKLILTCGAHPFIPPIPGANRDGVFALRTVHETRALRAAVQPGTPCVCIGGGILGLETAGALARCGAQVTLVENFAWLLPRQLDNVGAQVLERYVAKLGIQIQHSATTTELKGDQHVRSVALSDGTELPAEVVVIATGVRPTTHLARRAGLEVNQGIVVDSFLTTSCPAIYAAGDVAEHRGIVYGIWEPARFQGVIAGKNAAGGRVEFGGIPRANTLKVLGVNLFSVGEIEAKDGSYRVIAQEAGTDYARYLFRDSRLVGAILIGDTRLSATALKAVKECRDASGLLAQAPEVKDIGLWLDSASF